MIAYADHVRSPGDTPLAALDAFIDERLQAHVDGVHILPFAPWSSDGGFSVIDFEAVDTRYGSWADIESITSKRPVMFDAVINHMSAESTWFQGFLDDDPSYSGFFRTSDPSADHSMVVRPRTHPLLTPFTFSSGNVSHLWTTFSPDQVDLDYGEPAVLLRIIDVLLGYCRRGAAAIRLDAIGFLWKDEATPSIHLPQTHQLIQLMRSCIDEVAPGTILISETNVPHAENVSYLGDETPEVHAVYQFPLPPLAAHAAITGDTTVLEQWITGIDPIVGDQRSFLNFLACHDGIGVRPAEGLLEDHQLAVLINACETSGGSVGKRVLADGSTAPYELNTTWFELMAADTTEEIGQQRHLATHALMLALPGVAALYTQSLVGGDNDHAAVKGSGHARDINRTRFERADLDAELDASDTRAAMILDGLAALVARRRASVAFHPEGRCELLPSPSGAVAIQRSHAGFRAIVIVNFGDEAVHTREVLDRSQEWFELVTGRPAPALLPSGQSLWLESRP